MRLVCRGQARLAMQPSRDWSFTADAMPQHPCALISFCNPRYRQVGCGPRVRCLHRISQLCTSLQTSKTWVPNLTSISTSSFHVCVRRSLFSPTIHTIPITSHTSNQQLGPFGAGTRLVSLLLSTIANLSAPGKRANCATFLSSTSPHPPASETNAYPETEHPPDMLPVSYIQR